ncbi:unnamed protein product [Agarophyton chilense]|eukprot:gb/GEZJ01002731.1/.p1 GENE.gb/GEZJ01002731.1/~~gb/GEZJ01002731.1/.p1  ORF type:complete len:481 (+),score=47.22 gb/GEZJ01002731.1/:2795-4237(+)
MAEGEFLGFGAFETTAFCTSILVACYSLISNPSGRQSAFDSAEYQIFAGWRLALLCIAAQLVLMATVLAQQLVRTTAERTEATAWLLLLMVAPWAPLAGSVRNTLTSGARVRRMMRRRLARNELAAVLRDRFKFGQRAIAVPSVIFHATGLLPVFPNRALAQRPELAPHAAALRREAMMAAQLEEPNSLALGALWAMNQGLQPTSVSRFRLRAWKLISSVDPLARRWTVRTCVLNVDVMPDVPSIVERARYLDVIDLLQQGGTLSDELVHRGLGRFCHGCTLATRCAVEIFLESSQRSHTDLRAGEWLKNVGMDWAGSFERVIDVMWEACFMDSKALRVQGHHKDASPNYNDRSKVTTTKMLALLFIISRAVIGLTEDHPVFAAVCAVVADGSFALSWWTRYWERVGDKIRAKNGGHIVVDSASRSVFKACLRELVDEDMFQIVHILLHTPVQDRMCSDSSCFLHSARLVSTAYSPKSIA